MQRINAQNALESILGRVVLATTNKIATLPPYINPGGNLIESGASQMSLNFAHSPESQRNSAIARHLPEEERRLPYMEYCDFDKFLSLLVERHGERYLQRPDGDMLAYRRPDGHVAGTVVAPRCSTTPKRLRYSEHDRVIGAANLITEALADGPKSIDEIVEATGLKPNTIQNNFSADKGRTWRNIDAGWWRLAEGDEVGQEVASQTKAPVQDMPKSLMTLLPTARIEKALADGPMTVAEISAATGMGNASVAGALNRSKQKFRRMNLRQKNDKWRLVTADDGEDRGRAPLLKERIIAHIQAHGPTTTPDLAEALGTKRSTIMSECFRHANIVQAGKQNNRRAWTVQDE